MGKCTLSGEGHKCVACGAELDHTACGGHWYIVTPVEGRVCSVCAEENRIPAPA